MCSLEFYFGLMKFGCVFKLLSFSFLWLLNVILLLLKIVYKNVMLFYYIAWLGLFSVWLITIYIFFILTLLLILFSIFLTEVIILSLSLSLYIYIYILFINFCNFAWGWWIIVLFIFFFIILFWVNMIW